MTANEQPELRVTELDLQMLVIENTRLKTWVRGILQDCEGCKAQATAWAEAIDAEMEHK